MPSLENLKDFVVLVTGSKKHRDSFGTGFVIYKSREETYVLTCTHVVDDVGGVEGLKVDYKCATLVASDDKDSFDLAVLRVKDVLDTPALPLKVTAQQGSSVYLPGFSRFEEKRTAATKNATLAQEVTVDSERLGRARAWHLTCDSLKPGYSGAPVVDEKGENVLGVVCSYHKTEKQALAISIETLAALAKTWTNPPVEILDILQKIVSIEMLGKCPSMIDQRKRQELLSQFSPNYNLVNESSESIFAFFIEKEKQYKYAMLEFTNLLYIYDGQTDAFKEFIKSIQLYYTYKHVTWHDVLEIKSILSNVINSSILKRVEEEFAKLDSNVDFLNHKTGVYLLVDILAMSTIDKLPIFLHDISSLVENQIDKESIVDWINKISSQRGLDWPASQSKKRSVETDESPLLQIKVEPAPEHADQFLCKSWLKTPSGKREQLTKAEPEIFPFIKISNFIQKSVTQARVQLTFMSILPKLKIEIFVPRRHIDFAFETCECLIAGNTKGLLGAEHEVIVRSLERGYYIPSSTLDEEMEQKCGFVLKRDLWERKWAELPKKIEPHHFMWACESTNLEDDIAKKLREESTPECIYTTTRKLHNDSDEQEVLQTLEDLGVVLIIRQRNDRDDDDTFKKDLLTNFDQCTPNRIAEITRIKRFNEQSIDGRWTNLSLIIEDPFCIPEDSYEDLLKELLGESAN